MNKFEEKCGESSAIVVRCDRLVFVHLRGAKVRAVDQTTQLHAFTRLFRRTHGNPVATVRLYDAIAHKQCGRNRHTQTAKSRCSATLRKSSSFQSV